MKSNKTPIADLVNDAKEHYDELASDAMHFKSIIPTALDFYKNHGQQTRIVDPERKVIPEDDRRQLRLYKLEEGGEVFTIVARSAEDAKNCYKKHLKDIAVPISHADIDSVDPVSPEQEINVHYPDHRDKIEVTLRAEQWVAICATMKVEWNILCSSAWV